MSSISSVSSSAAFSQTAAASTRKPEVQNDHDADDGVQAAAPQPKAQAASQSAINSEGRLDTQG